MPARELSHLHIGVLGIQGAVVEHIRALEACGARASIVRTPFMLDGLDGLILPGGESTTIGRLIDEYGYDRGIERLAGKGKPIWGTCAGMILLAESVENQDPLLQLMSITVRRNAYGRQRESFEADLEIPFLGAKPFRGVFIRAPLILSVGEGVDVLSRFRKQIVAARQGHFLATSFHPELTDDLRFHDYFLRTAQAAATVQGAFFTPDDAQKPSSP